MAKNEKIESKIIEFLALLDKKPVRIMNPGIGFNYPRILSMIINEAYFARAEGRAKEKAIDEAMLYGVNYPLGPFDWCQKIGAGLVVRLLDELFKVTDDPRYKVCPELRQEGL